MLSLLLLIDRLYLGVFKILFSFYYFSYEEKLIFDYQWLSF